MTNLLENAKEERKRLQEDLPKSQRQLQMENVERTKMIFQQKKNANQCVKMKVNKTENTFSFQDDEKIETI